MTFRNAEWAIRANEEVTRFVETGDCRTPDVIAAAERAASQRAVQIEQVAQPVGALAGSQEFPSSL